MSEKIKLKKVVEWKSWGGLWVSIFISGLSWICYLAGTERVWRMIILIDIAIIFTAMRIEWPKRKVYWVKA